MITSNDRYVNEAWRASIEQRMDATMTLTMLSDADGAALRALGPEGAAAAGGRPSSTFVFTMVSLVYNTAAIAAFCEAVGGASDLAVVVHGTDTPVRGVAVDPNGVELGRVVAVELYAR